MAKWNQYQEPTQQVEPPAAKKQCGECKGYFPLTSEHFKSNALMPDGFNKTCKPCIKERSRRKREERIAASKAKHLRNLHDVMNNSKYGCPVEGELWALVTANLGGVEAVANSIADSYRACVPGSITQLTWQRDYLAGVKRHTDRVASKTDIHNMTTKQIREELDKKIKQAIAGVIQQGDVLKMPNTG